jgi:hypothetical protein
VIVADAPETVIGPEQRPPATGPTLKAEPPDGATVYENGRPDIPLDDDLQISITCADAAWAPTTRTPTVVSAMSSATRRSLL